MSGLYGLFSRRGARPTDGLLNQLSGHSGHRTANYINLTRNRIGMGVAESGTGEFLLTADIRLDNRTELCHQLGLNADTSTSDARIVINAYRQWGEPFVERLTGDFSFALWDEHRQTMICARDHLGVKPFYYLLDGEHFVFASEANIIGVIPSLECTISSARLVDYRVDWLESVDKRCTFFNEVHRLPPASMLIVDANSHQEHTYWELDAGREVYFPSDDDYQNAFNELARNAVQCRTRTGKGGVMLSGGVDSSLVSAIAIDLGEAPLPAYSGVLPKAAKDGDSECVRLLLEKLNLIDRSLETTAQSNYYPQLNKSLERIGEPFDASMFQSYLLYIRAAGDGCDYVLDGVDGDIPHSLPSSYPLWIAKQDGIVDALTEVYWIWRRWYDRDQSLPALYLQYLKSMLIPRALREAKQKIMGTSTDREYRQLMRDFDISPSIAIKTGLHARIAQEHANYAAQGSSLKEQRVAHMSHPALAVALERYDRVAASCGVEARHPLLDKRLVEFSLAIPEKQSGSQGWSKYLMRRVAAQYLPHEVAWRTSDDDNGGDFILRWATDQQNLLRDKVESSIDQVGPYGFRMTKDSEDVSNQWTTFCLVSWLSYVTKARGNGIVVR
jgi:asparagine synthase (glutamine-hydrolysing)